MAQTESLSAVALPTRMDRVRGGMITAATALGAFAFVAFLIWHAPYERDEVVPYDTVLSVRDGWYASHYFGGAALGIGLIAFAIASWLLVRHGPGSGLVTVGGALTALAGVPIATGLGAEGVAYSYATDQNALPAQQGAVLLEYMFQHSERYVVLLIAGLVTMAAGSLLIACGLVRARAVPVWVPIALAVGTVFMMVTPHAVTWWASLPAAVAKVAVAWYTWTLTAAPTGQRVDEPR